MDDIIKKLGFANDKTLNMTNKVTIQISSNEYEESNPYIEETDLFNQIEDISSIYRKKSIKTECIKTECIKTECIITGPDALILCVLEMLDPTVSLLSNKVEKIENFKRKIMLNYTNYDTTSISLFLKKTIIIKEDNIYSITGSYDDYILIDKKQSNYSLIKELDSKKLTDFYNHNIETIIKSYINDGILTKLDKMMVKELKDIAEKINVNTFKIENNKKRQLLKNEIKDVLKTKFDKYII